MDIDDCAHTPPATPRTATPERRATVPTNDGVALSARAFGPSDAPVTVVCVHGHCLRMESWRRLRLAPRLQASVQIVLYDQRGHGRSADAPVTTYTIGRLADDLDAILRTVDARSRIVLLGHSMGGMVIQSWVCRHAESIGTRVVGVGLIASATHDVAGPDTADVVSSLIARAGRTPPETVSGFLPALACHDGRPALRWLSTIPTLIVCGTNDTVTPPRHSVQMADRLAGSELVRIDSAGHLVLLERAEEVSAAVGRLIGRIGDDPHAPGPRR